MIVKDLLARFGFAADLSGLAKADRGVDKTRRGVDGIEAAWGAATAALAAYGIGGEIQRAVAESNKLGEAFGRIQTLIPGNIARAKELRDGIKALSLQTGKSQEELAGGVYEVISAFGDVPDTLKLTEIATKAAVAGNADAKASLDLLSGAMLAYGQTSATSAQQIADQAFVAVKLGKTSLPELAAGFGKVTGSARSLGIEQRELFAILGTAAGVTGPTAEVFTQLKATMTSLASPTDTLRKLYKKLGIQNIETEVRARGLVPTLQRIVGATDGTVKATAKLFASDEARGLILPLINDLSKRYADTLGDVSDASGAAAEAFDAQTGGLATTATQAKLTEARAASLRAELGDRLAPVVGSLQLGLVQIAADLSETLIPALGGLQGGAGYAADSLAPVTLAANAARIVFAGLAEAVTTAGAAMKVIGVSFGGVGAAAAAGVTGDFAGVGAINAAMERDFAAIGKEWTANTQRLGQVIADPEASRLRADLDRIRADALAETTQLRAERSTRAAAAFTGNAATTAAAFGAVNVNAPIGGITINVPAGTPDAQAAHVARAGVGAMLDGIAREMRRTIPNPQVAQ